ncbi:helix-turn-helix domain-containing protein [Chitinimonas sp. BJYL2]|uniref:helix-turn-helix domain-containing protein n=1 Tax=Chitinimonas sp. BJYL2 TaxID=2976696 RepID=UPI0022B5AF51|nr:helix-turn-helix transcriptional regulator [Chitinimonas sp. BJYL2]
MSDEQDDVLAKRIGKAIAKQRQLRNLTQEEVAERLKIGNEAVSRIERGVAMPTVARLMEFAEIFQCDASALLDEAGYRSSDQALHLSRQLDQLNPIHRQMVIEVVERLVTDLAVTDRRKPR